MQNSSGLVRFPIVILLSIFRGGIVVGIEILREGFPGELGRFGALVPLVIFAKNFMTEHRKRGKEVEVRLCEEERRNLISM